MGCLRDAENGVALAPRGSAKTTWDDTILLAWLIARFAHLRVGLISNTAKQSNDFSRAIKWTFESNQRHREIFGDLVSSEKWTDVEWLRKDSRWHGSNNVTLYSGGAGSAIISKRFDLILCDDILDEENTAGPEVQEKVETWFLKTLMPCLVPGGSIIILGTRWGEDDLYQKLSDPIEKGGKGWRLILRQALLGPEGGPYTSYWPDYWPVETLLALREGMGTALFSCAYQNDIRGLMTGNIFQKANYQYFETLPEGRHYTIRMGIDLASSERERADYTARCTTAQDEQGNFFVLSVVRDKRESHHAEFVVDGYLARPDMSLVRVENQQFQSTLIQEVMRDHPSIPIEGVRADVDKVTRARAVSAKYEAHKVYHHISLRDSDFEREQLAFPKGHDDMVDAEGLSMDLGGGGFFFGSVRTR